MTGTDSPPSTTERSSNWKAFALCAGLLVAGFSLPLYRWARFAIGHELYSHLVLIPFVSLLLAWFQKDQLLAAGKRLSPLWAVLSGSAGLALLGMGLRPSPAANTPALQDSLALACYALVCGLIAVGCQFLNRPTFARLAFPLFFLAFMAPFPVAVEAQLESLLQHGSAPVAQFLMEALGTPVFREETFFSLPGFKMHLAPECSGIHSTLALFITSVVAGQMLLRSRWRRLALTLAVIPIALLRNGFRVATIGELCIRIGPEMIDSAIHHHGGPIFFALSLVPFSLLLFLLIKTDRRQDRSLKN